MKCPRDSTNLFFVDMQSQNLYNCLKCNGYLLKPIKLSVVDNIIDISKSNSELYCPECQELMIKSNLPNLEIDVCNKCKWIWLDKDEIYRLAKNFNKNELYKGNGMAFFIVSEILNSLPFLNF